MNQTLLARRIQAKSRLFTGRHFQKNVWNQIYFYEARLRPITHGSVSKQS
jgi:hypothetical protein